MASSLLFKWFHNTSKNNGKNSPRSSSSPTLCWFYNASLIKSTEIDADFNFLLLTVMQSTTKNGIFDRHEDDDDQDSKSGTLIRSSRAGEKDWCEWRSFCCVLAQERCECDIDSDITINPIGQRKRQKDNRHRIPQFLWQVKSNHSATTMMNNMSDDFDDHEKFVLLIGRTGSGEFSSGLNRSNCSSVEFR